MPKQATNLTWADVPAEACRLAKEAGGPYQVISDLLPALPYIKASVWYNPDIEHAFFSYPLGVDTDKVASWHIALKQVPGVDTVTHGYFSVPPDDRPYIRVKEALTTASLFHPVASAAQMEPNALNKLWGGPNPLSATIGGGLLGAGLGYAGGWLAEQVMPKEYFEPGVLRRNTALLGGAMGAAPGIWNGFDQQFRGPDPGVGAWTRTFPWHKESASRFTLIKAGLPKALPAHACELNEMWEKMADEAGADFEPSIPVDQFGRTIWNDLRGYGGFTQPPVAAAATGVLQAASLAQGGVNYVSPMDIARIGVGMGSGYLSGRLVGRTLGALAGLRPEAQQTLQQIGVWSGVLNNVVPMLFR